MTTILAATADSQFRTYYELSPLLPVSEWWHAIVLISALIAVLTITLALYFFDSIELKPGVAFALGLLRVVAILGIVVFFLNPEKRSQKQIIKNTRVPILVDTSSSMAGTDFDPQMGEQGLTPRIDRVMRSLFPTNDAQYVSMIEQLREENDVALYRFDDSPRPELVASFPSKRKSITPEQALEEASQAQRDAVQAAKVIATVAVVLLVLGLALSVGYALTTLWSVSFPGASFQLTAGSALIIAALAVLAWADLTASDSGLMVVAGIKPFEAKIPSDMQDEPKPELDDATEANGNGQTPVSTGELTQEELNSIKTELEANGNQTRLGDAIADIVRRERGRPIAGVFVITDGQKTAGVEVGDAIRAAAESGMRFFPIGVGNPERPRDVRIVELQGPQRVFPQDKFLVKGVIQSFGYEGKTAQLELSKAFPNAPDNYEVEASLPITLPADGEPMPFEFELDSGQVGKRLYQVQVTPEPIDFATGDNLRALTVDVIERKNRVLLIAGGPNRDYRFLRNQLYRDEDTVLHVYLQTARPGVAQESDLMLFDFPRLKEELFEYDCIIAFDPDWRVLDADQAKLLEEWVAEQAGGLVVIAGPVFTPKWTRRARGDETIDLIRRLYPVSFFSQGSASYALGRFGGDTAFPLAFSREGRSAPFLWIRDTALESQAAWDDFAGVYGYYAVNDPKPGAIVYADFADPKTMVDGKLPIYFAGQFYGAGRVFFQASAEMWRLRAEDVEFFEQYYTKLIHWVSQGRLMRDSRRGVLIADKTQVTKGDPITMQALLRDAQDRPLTLDSVDVVITVPGGGAETLTLQGAAGEQRAGAYVARYLPRSEGNYRVRLPVPGGAEDEILTLEFTVDIPLFEQQQSERNDPVLQSLADATNGQYITEIEQLSNVNDQRSDLLTMVRANDEQLYRVYLPATTDKIFSRRLMAWLLIIIVSALCLEWTLRRLHRLA